MSSGIQPNSARPGEIAAPARPSDRVEWALHGLPRSRPGIKFEPSGRARGEARHMGSTTGHPMQRPSRGWHARRRAAAILGLVSFFVAGSRGDEPGRDDLARYDARVKAEDREHWTFQPVVEPEVPSVKNTAWVHNPIDAFVLAEL